MSRELSQKLKNKEFRVAPSKGKTYVRSIKPKDVFLPPAPAPAEIDSDMDDAYESPSYVVMDVNVGVGTPP